MRWLLVLIVAGCGFSVHASTGDAAPGPDSAIDGPPDGDPSRDTDQDGVNDAIDNCPQLANPDQHDWDHDGHGDACDHCPHLFSNPDPDGDGDGVGDACDPRPTLAGDTRVIWQGFFGAAEITGWRHSNLAGVWTSGGVLSQTDPLPGLTLLDSPLNYGDVYFASRMEIVVPLGTSQTEIGVCGGDIPQGFQYYCCAINGASGKTVRAASAWTGSGGQIQGAVAWPGTAAVGDTIDVTGTMTSVASSCTFKQGGTVANASTARGPLAAGSAVFYTQVTQARYHYIFVVTIGS
jgi:hypothetical protein